MFRNIVNGTLSDEEIRAGYVADSSANAKLTADINVNPGFTFNSDSTYTADAGVSGKPEQWYPIGYEYYDSTISDTVEVAFSGTFDGNGHTISGLYRCDSNEIQRDVGLFGRAKNANIKNITINNSYIENTHNYYYVGSVVGWMQGGSLENCHTTASTTVACNGQQGHAGGIAGGVLSVIEVYESLVTVRKCSNAGTVKSEKSTSDSMTGGIVGYLYYSTIENCYNSGNISGARTGGIVGATITSGSYKATIRYCFNVGLITSLYSNNPSCGIGPGSASGSPQLTEIYDCYYLEGTAVDSANSNKEIVDVTERNVITKTSEQFSNGEVTYLLNALNTDGTPVWGQNLPDSTFAGSEPYPQFNDKVVYKLNDGSYSNSPNSDTNSDNETELCKYGDVNHDGSVTALDSYVLLRSLVGYHTLNTYESFIGDINNDDEINTVDILAILRHAVGYSSENLTNKEVEVPIGYFD